MTNTFNIQGLNSFSFLAVHNAYSL
jgi:hypothetical protein